MHPTFAKAMIDFSKQRDFQSLFESIHSESSRSYLFLEQNFIFLRKPFSQKLIKICG